MKKYLNAPSVKKEIIEAKRWKKQEVTLRGYSLDTVPPELCQDQLICSLQKLDLSHNLLKQLPLCLWSLVNLQYLIVTHNKLKELPAEIVALKKLKKLNVCHNEIETIPSYALIKLQHLRELNFSGNLISEIDCIVLHLPLLQKFFITKNPLQNIPKSASLNGLVGLRNHFGIQIPIPAIDDMELDTSVSVLDEMKKLKLRLTPTKDRTSSPSIQASSRIRRAFSFEGLASPNFNLTKNDCHSPLKPGSKQFTPPKLSKPLNYSSPKLKRALSFSEISSPFLGGSKFKFDFQLESDYTYPVIKGSSLPTVVNQKTKTRVSTSDYSSCSTDFVTLPPSEIIKDKETSSICGGYRSENEDENDADTEHSFDFDDCFASFSDESGCKESLQDDGAKCIKYKNIMVRIPKSNKSAVQLQDFEIEVVEDLFYVPNTSDRATHGSQIISLEPHGTQFYSEDPAIIDLPLSVPVEFIDQVICLCSQTTIGEPPVWEKIDRKNFSLHDNRVRIKTEHFSLFTILICKEYPEVEKKINAFTGGSLSVPSVPGVKAFFPPNSLDNDINAKIKLYYGDEPYGLDNVNEVPLALATPVVMLEPHGYIFKAPVEVHLPIPDCSAIMCRFGLNPFSQLTIWTSQTQGNEELSWQKLNTDYRISIDDNGEYSVSFKVNHFSWFRAMWDCVAGKFYEAKIGVSYVYPYIEFSMLCQALMEESPESLSFGLEVVCYKSDRRFPDVGNYRRRVGGSIKPRMIKPGTIQISLRSETFEADVKNGEYTDLKKIEFDFRGREFEKQFACVYKAEPKSKGVFGKVVVERVVQAGLFEPLFEFNLTKSGNEAETILESADKWSLLPIKELANLLSISNDDNWKPLARNLGFTNHEINSKLSYTDDPLAIMLGSYQARGGTVEEYIQALYEVGRRIKLNAGGMKDNAMEIGFNKHSLSLKSNTSGEEDDLEESLNEVLRLLGPKNNSTPKRKRSVSSHTSAKQNWRESLETNEPAPKRNRRESLETNEPAPKRNRRESVENDEPNIQKSRRESSESRRESADYKDPLSDQSEAEQTFYENRQELSDGDLWRLSEGLVKKWKQIGRTLNIPEADLISVEHTDKNDARECAYQMLLRFKDRYPKKCRYGYMYKILCESALNGVARKYCRGRSPSVASQKSSVDKMAD